MAGASPSAAAGLTLRMLAASPSAVDGGASPADVVAARLRAAGIAEEAIAEKRAMFGRAAQRLIDEGLAPEVHAKAFWVPGRIEIAGKHTDYAGGRSLLAATSRGFAVVSVDRDDDICRIFTAFGGSLGRSSASLRIHKDLEPQQGHWSAYPATAIRRLARNFDIHSGVDVAVECDLPESSGMSTSSAVICYMWVILAERNGVQATDKFREHLKTPEELYSYLGFIENGQNCGSVLVGDKGVGTFGGSEDHTAIMSCDPNTIKMFSYCPTKHEGTFNFPEDSVFVIAVSGAIAEKTGNAMADYNNAAFLARDAAAAWCKSTGKTPLDGETFVQGRPNLAEVVRHSRAESEEKSEEKLRSEISEAIARVDDGKTFGPNPDDPSVRYAKGSLKERFEQFFDESEIMVPKIAKALADSDYDGLGKWSDESHRQTVECLRNIVPETAWLPQEARRRGALGASAFGAGFGGSCWALVRKRGAEAFADDLGEAYRKKFPRCADRSTFFVMAPGPGAFSVHGAADGRAA
mmetsp:Transcript_88606/g.225541  ORF Transcript_88606/g.225541 Transcript_88606/m.225541 type:complete len:522 (+) Transcript_88606:69-1634(+)